MEIIAGILAICFLCCLAFWLTYHEVKRTKAFTANEEKRYELLEAVLRKVEEIDG